MKMQLEKGLENAVVTTIVEGDHMATIEAKIDEPLQTEMHMHKKCYEMYEVDEGKMMINLKKGKKIKQIELNPENKKFFILNPGAKHSVCIDEGSVVNIYRFTTEKKPLSVLYDLQSIAMCV